MPVGTEIRAIPRDFGARDGHLARHHKRGRCEHGDESIQSSGRLTLVRGVVVGSELSHFS